MTDIPDSNPVKTAWHIHAAFQDWMGKVDLKATFTLTLDTAVLAGVITMSKDDGLFAGLSGWSLAFYLCGLALLTVSALSAVWVVLPRLRTPLDDTDFIYFGNLHRRHLDAEQIKTELETKDVLLALSGQLRRVSEIAWKKHCGVQVALWCVVLAALSLVVSFNTR
ncbi:Pycsar system effector family protein [Nocardia sp. NPDC005366]|uniref:Pycsar system effector family protein n=1 Tax=Nocardia sp. NPDC005366 TaxID=3156878 RepID=UPI0033B243F8